MLKTVVPEPDGPEPAGSLQERLENQIKELQGFLTKLTTGVLPEDSLKRNLSKKFINPIVLENLRYICSSRNPRFSKRVGMSYPVWKKFVCEPLVYLLRQSEYHTSGHTLPHEYRVFRYYLRLRGEKVLALADLTDQDPSTVTRDFRKCLELAETLVNHWVRPLTPGTIEYTQHVGKCAFREFPGTVYSLDGTRVFHHRPTEDQRVYYNGKYKRHGSHFIFGVDCVGVCRMIMGPAPLTIVEDELVRRTNLYRKTRNFSNLFEPGHHCVYDGGFQYTKIPFIIPKFRGKNKWKKIIKDLVKSEMYRNCNPTQQGRLRLMWYKHHVLPAERRDKKLVHSRYIVEHYFSRLKGTFPVVDQYKLGSREDCLGSSVRVCTMYLNISIMTEKPMQTGFECAWDRRCMFCRNFRNRTDNWYMGSAGWIEELYRDTV